MSRQRGLAAPVILVVVALIVTLLGGIAVDMWRVLESHRRLVGVVDAAATAGAGAVDVDAFRASPEAPPRVDPEWAVGRACAVLVDAGLDPCPGPWARVSVTGDEVRVAARRIVEMTFIGRLGFGAAGDGGFTVGADSMARLLRGIGAPP